MSYRKVKTTRTHLGSDQDHYLELFKRSFFVIALISHSEGIGP